MLLCERDNDNDAGFAQSDGRLPSLPEPTLRDAKRDFQGRQPMRELCKYSFCRGRNMASH